MPLPIPFEWTEDDTSLYFTLHLRGAKAKLLDVQICDVYAKVNHHPSFFEADLLHEVDVDHPDTRCKISKDRVNLTLRKKESGLWREFRATGTKAELRERRRLALAAALDREKAYQERKTDTKEKLLKAGEHEQWRLDRENREQIEKWEQEEKEKWENDFYASFDEAGNVDPERESTGKTPPALEATAKSYEIGELEQEPRVTEVTDDEAEQIRMSVAKDSEEATLLTIAGASATTITTTEVHATDKDAIWNDSDFGVDREQTVEYTPPVRDNLGKIGIGFTARQRQGVPSRDRGKPQPFPSKTVKSELPPMLEGDHQYEDDPVWLKDKADTLMVAGDYEGAYNAYTSALKIGLNARAFANRSVASLYLGKLEQAVEDGTRALALLDQRRKVPDGHMPPPEDPENMMIRARVEIRIGTAYLWLGAFKKAEEHFEKSLDVESHSLDMEERRKVKEDLEGIRKARETFVLKDQADAGARLGGTNPEKHAQLLAAALDQYDAAVSRCPENAVLYANRSYAELCAGKLQESIADSDKAMDLLRRWPAARRAPKAPARPARLDAPFLDDPTFKHPDQPNEVDWLMKHSGGSTADLPPLPPEYEWMRDAKEGPDAWIAIRRKMTKAVIDAIKQSTTVLQDAVYTRSPEKIQKQVKLAIEQNKTGEGPSAKAITEAEEYASRLKEHTKVVEAYHAEQEESLQQEFGECDLDKELAPIRVGQARVGFSRSHPVQTTRRRLYVKVRLRRARALELLNDVDMAAVELGKVLHVEPGHQEAKRRLVALNRPVEALPAHEAVMGLPELEPLQAHAASTLTALGSAAVTASSQKPCASKRDTELDDDEPADHGSTSALIASAAEYMKRNDYRGALQLYNYLRRQKRLVTETPLVELKVLSNTTLCYQRIRGMVPELISSCTEALGRIAKLWDQKDHGGVGEEMLLRMEAAVLSRRGSAYGQQQKAEPSEKDAVRVREVLAKLDGLESTSKT